MYEMQYAVKRSGLACCGTLIVALGSWQSVDPNAAVLP